MKTQKCPLCSDSHGLFRCKTFLESRPEAKRDTVQRLNLCKNCLFDHKDKQCYSEAKCRVCQETHNTLLHDAFQPKTPSTSREHKLKTNVSHVANEYISEVLLATALIRVKGVNGAYHTMRALIDQGSQASLISENAAQMLGLPRQACKGVIFGIGSNQSNSKGAISIIASSMYSDFEFQTEAVIMNTLINHLPNKTFAQPSWPYLENIQLADPEYYTSRAIDLLLGADVFAQILMSGIIKVNESLPVAQQTHLGWILSGNVKSLHCNVVMNNIQDIQEFWKIEDVAEGNINMSRADQQCIQQYNSETIRRKDGRYIVRLPLKTNIKENLGESKKKAAAQFYQLEKQFSRNSYIADNYKSFIEEYIKLGHMRRSVQPNLPDCILPHHCVLRPDSSTTTLRVVFNASAKTSTGYSLNDLMYSGPNLQQDLFSIILRWRQYKYAITADIEKMFRQIFCNEKDLQFQKILWRFSPHEMLREYELTTVTYGTKAAPFLAMMTLKRLAEDERSKYPEASAVLEQCFYMDDLLAGHHSIQGAKQLKTDLISLLNSGGFNLRKWSSNKQEVLGEDTTTTKQAYEFKHQESTKTLGLRWHSQEDHFQFQNNIDVSTIKRATKRSLLSDISKIFDPLGWLSPLTTQLKLLFQSVWSLKLKWDDQIPEEINERWLKIKKDLPEMEQIHIARWIKTNENAHIELHGFCDASTKAYACVIYCRIIEQNNQGQESPVIIVAGKSKLVPINKTVSLPRLELCAAQLLAKLAETVQASLSSYNMQLFGWSDSTAVLGWIQGDPNRWKPFVANRVEQITKIIPTKNWHYVKSTDNPADCASRGSSAEQLKQHPLWWHGPSWLSSFDERVRQDQKYSFNTNEEIKKVHLSNVTQQDAGIVQNILNKYSTFNRASRVLAWILRAIAKNQPKPHYLTITELRKARHLLIKHVQHLEFTDDIINLQKQNQVSSKSKLLQLHPFLDQEGLLRVGGRLRHAKINQNMKHPIIIPNNCHLSNLLIDQGHQMTYHGGARLTQMWLRQKYWILGGNRAIKKRLRNCIKCRRQDPLKQEQLMGDLPPARSNPTRPFYHTGVDYTGFIDIKTNKGRGVKTTKGYIAVFVCMATKAVHLELVSDLSSSSFLAALRRMAARRGAPGHIYSDNGTNFVGASRLLKEEFVNIQLILDVEFHNAITDMNITWHFNAPSWPSAGGLWEGAVKSLKYHLKRVIGDQKLTFEEYTTVLAQLEACLNSRPLCALSEDSDDIDCLTPSHFLSSGPTLTLIETERDLRTRWQLTQKIFNDIWKRWRAEYLSQLSVRSKWRKSQENLKIDDIVIVQDINLPPGKWPLGRITELFPGKDGYVRVVTVRTKNGFIKRPITRLSLLPIHENQTQHDNTKPKQPTVQKRKQTRSTSKLCNFVYFILLLVMTFAHTVRGDYKISTLSSNQSIYFDKIAHMRLEQDEWKLIVYCDMSPYWRGIDLLSTYEKHLDSICSTQHISQCDVVRLQLRHGHAELDHYNNVLLSQQGSAHKRTRRGLINGVGYVAHSLFGILDNDFAEKYEEDIKLIHQNQDHLARLWKNQTSIVEAELNVIKRVEVAMEKQHKMINQYMINLDLKTNKLADQIQRTDGKSEFTLTSLIAVNILTSLRNIQESLVDTVADIFNEKFNHHLLTPAQLRDELNIITGQLSQDLVLPINNIQTDLTKLYHLLKVKARTTNQYLIFEVRIPLVRREDYELYHLIQIPQQIGKSMVTLTPIASHIAINLRKDLYIPMSINDIQTCVPYNSDDLICPLKRLVYQMTSDNSLCIKNSRSDDCRAEKTECTDKWTELNIINSYLYYCCGQCTVRIICGDRVTSEQLSKAGVIALSDGCVIKGTTFTIYSHRIFTNTIYTKPDVIASAEIPTINNIINLTLPLHLYNETDEAISRQQDLRRIDTAIENIKSNEAGILPDHVTHHDIHHYVVIYVLVTFVGVCGFLYVWRHMRGRRETSSQQPQQMEQGEPSVHFVARGGRPVSTILKHSSAEVVHRATTPVFKKKYSI